METYQLIYSSRPFGYDEATLNGILLDARRCNSRDNITGALVCRRDVFVQLLEGPKEEVWGTFERIRLDDRHIEVKLRYFGESRKRLFANWAMLHDPARSWLWSRSQIADGALNNAGVTGFKRIFETLSEAVKSDGV